ncbi:MAG: hypothetical protein JRI25_00855 [Deltaproteobacteria bacterium]|nr:hypothetical protein [Deltaproteobacteria bacterium]MBW2253127.1 hypothetical protein [Deltaproteobacteria bacterium]
MSPTMNGVTLGLGLLLAAPAEAQRLPDDPLLQPLVEELERSVAELSLPDAPPVYNLRYKALTLEQVDARASLGTLVKTSADPLRILFVEVRVGEPSFDNTGFGGWQNGFQSNPLTLDSSSRAARNTAWRVTDRAYKEAVEQYARKAAQFTPPDDYPGDYTLIGAVIDDQGSGGAGEAEPLRDLARELSGAMAVTPDNGATLELGAVHLGHEGGAILILDTEGTRLRYPVEETTVRATVHVRAVDGMLLTDQRLWTVRNPSDLPPREAMVAEAERMTRDLLATAESTPLEEEYVGPVIFEDGAALDLFRYVLVPQLQGTPPEVPFDSFFGELGGGRHDAVRLSRRVLPPGWTVTDDPRDNPEHPGSFTYDAEGTPAQAVTAVTDGIVRSLFMSRVPRIDLGESNGHARGGLGSRAEGRPAQLEVTPARHLSPTKLRSKALRLASSYGRDYVVVVRRLQDPAARNLASGGASYLDAERSELPMPVEIVRRYTDGREEHLRGAQFAGVQRFVLRDIVAAGEQMEGSFMASTMGNPWTYGPTEGLPTWISAPSVLVGEMELVPSPGDPKTVPLVPPPALSAAP